MTAEKKKKRNGRDSNTPANSASTQNNSLYGGSVLSFSAADWVRENKDMVGGESSRCDNCDKSRQSVALRNTAQISPSLFFPPQDDSLMSTTCNIYSHRVSDCRAVPESTKNATY